MNMYIFRHCTCTLYPSDSKLFNTSHSLSIHSWLVVSVCVHMRAWVRLYVCLCVFVCVVLHIGYINCGWFATSCSRLSLYTTRTSLAKQKVYPHVDFLRSPLFHCPGEATDYCRAACGGHSSFSQDHPGSQQLLKPHLLLQQRHWR